MIARIVPPQSDPAIRWAALRYAPIDTTSFLPVRHLIETLQRNNRLPE